MSNLEAAIIRVVSEWQRSDTAEDAPDYDGGDLSDILKAAKAYPRLMAEREELVAALRRFQQSILPVGAAIGPAGEDVWPEIAEAIIHARALLARIEKNQEGA